MYWRSGGDSIADRGGALRPATEAEYTTRMASEHDRTEFPITSCAVCGRDVLCYLDLDGDEREIVRCLECSTIATSVRFADLHAIEALGYGYVLPEAGCGRPDCGRGRCGRSA